MALPTTTLPVEISAPAHLADEMILSPEALSFLAALHEKFNRHRLALLARRAERQAQIDQGQMPLFLPETQQIRLSSWQVAATPADLQDRRVEITGPAERKMMINALNSGAKVFMADLEDALSPTWENIINGQINLYDAVRRNIAYTAPDGKAYALNAQTAVLVVRPRGWHLEEKHVLVNGEPIAASLFDFGLYFFHNAHESLRRGTAPYFYLPKLENHLEARLWNAVFEFAQKALDIPYGTIRATVLIETILAAFEMDEILFELRDHAAGLNAGRWDYIFSAIKKFRNHPLFMLPDRAQVGMTVPFMRAYTELMVQTCHKRGAHAIGGMAAFIPNKNAPETTAQAIEKVRQDKQREAQDGCDGTWVAHPGLVAVAQEVFDAVLGDQPHQKNRLRSDVQVSDVDLINLPATPGTITEDGLRTNIAVALQYLEAWLGGNGAAAINNLMEDVATAEISRGQLWQWMYHSATLDDGRLVTPRLYERLRHEELVTLRQSNPDGYKLATQLLDELVLGGHFIEFLPHIAYQHLD